MGSRCRSLTGQSFGVCCRFGSYAIVAIPQSARTARSTFPSTRWVARSPSRSIPCLAAPPRPEKGCATPLHTIDLRTGEVVDLPFACGSVPVNNTYINKALVPMLCREAGIERDDVSARFTGDRAWARISSQLYDMQKPMILFELQA